MNENIEALNTLGRECLDELLSGGYQDLSHHNIYLVLREGFAEALIEGYVSNDPITEVIRIEAKATVGLDCDDITGNDPLSRYLRKCLEEAETTDYIISGRVADLLLQRSEADLRTCLTGFLAHELSHIVAGHVDESKLTRTEQIDREADAITVERGYGPQRLLLAEYRERLGLKSHNYLDPAEIRESME